MTKKSEEKIFKTTGKHEGKQKKRDQQRATCVKQRDTQAVKKIMHSSRSSLLIMNLYSKKLEETRVS